MFKKTFFTEHIWASTSISSVAITDCFEHDFTCQGMTTRQAPLMLLRTTTFNFEDIISTRPIITLLISIDELITYYHSQDLHSIIPLSLF